jgi:hypothetical protein
MPRCRRLAIASSAEGSAQAPDRATTDEPGCGVRLLNTEEWSSTEEAVMRKLIYSMGVSLDGSPWA